MIRLAVFDDLPVLREIYLAGMRGLHARGVPQWSETYPVSLIPEDIKKCELFIFEAGRAIAGAMALNRHRDAWLRDIQFPPADALYVHRLVMNPAMQGRGYAKRFMLWAADYARLHGGTALRLDTNTLNLRAINLYERLGYQRRGTLNELGSEYTAFELVI